MKVFVVCGLVLWACSDPGGRGGRYPPDTGGDAGGDAADAPGGDALAEVADGAELADDGAAAGDSAPEIGPETVAPEVVADTAASDTAPPDVVEPCDCRIGGVCVREGARDPDNLCHVCRAGASATAWTDDDGKKCTDGDACTVGESCLFGLCGGGRRVDDPACSPVEPPCTTHFDCYPDRVCGLWRTDGALHCSEACGADGECQLGERCVKAPGAAQVGYCEPLPASPSGLLADGAACADDASCESGVCLAGSCRAACLTEAACASGTCRLEDDAAERARGEATSGCAPDGALITNGQVCTPDGQSYGGVECSSGHCDLMPYPESLSLPCAPLCRAEADCGPVQECAVVMYGEAPHPSAVAFHPLVQARTHDAITACFTTRTGGGVLGDGQACSAPDQCRSDKCLHLLPGDPQRYCTSLCAFDADCPSGMVCKLDALTLASPWFQSPTINAQPPRLDARTLVRVCKFE